MASRLFRQFSKTLESGVVTLYANIPIGASGAVGTLVSSKNQGIYSVVKDATGKYIINFGTSASAIDTYTRLLDVTGSALLTTASNVSTIQASADDADTGSITILTLDDTGAAAHPDNGAVLLVTIRLKNSSVR